MKDLGAGTHVDVAVIGAGFAGLIAARELRNAGLSVAVWEARDRIGGRVWTDARFGHNLEMGGTWVHWSQPHTWAELTRYGILIDPSPKAQRVYWLREDGTVAQNTPDEFDALIAPLQQELVADSRRVFPRPDRPGMAAADPADSRTMRDRFDELAVFRTARTASEAIWASHINGSLDAVALTACLRWSAATCGGWRTLHEASSTYRVDGGMTQFVHHIAEGLQDKIRLNMTVVRVEQQSAQSIRIVAADGHELTARTLVVTAPFAALRHIAFSPELPEGVRALGGAALGNTGVKVWVEVEGEVAPFSAYASERHPLIMAKTEFIGDSRSVLVAFGADHKRFNADALDDAQAMMSLWQPGLRVTAVTTHNWFTDPAAETTWQLLKPGMLKHVSATQQAWGSVWFASSDNANLWPGFIDGAIERGLAVSREIIDGYA